jgi:hypothetical protein
LNQSKCETGRSPTQKGPKEKFLSELLREKYTLYTTIDYESQGVGATYKKWTITNGCFRDRKY